MKYLFLEYPKCSTCQKARQWLLDNGVEFEDRHIVDNRPTEAELKEWIERSGREPRSFFNTSGLRYKALNLKEKLPGMSDAEQISLLASTACWSNARSSSAAASFSAVSVPGYGNS